MTDVNTAFAAERTAQAEAALAARGKWDERIASGKLTPLGDGRFRVNDPGSWDNGEVLTERNGLILPESGLDMSLGSAALYTSTPAWHGLGNVIPGGISDVAEVLRLSGLDFTVEPRKVRYYFGELREVGDHFVNVRTDTGDCVGVVGSRYTAFQNADAFAFLQELTDAGDAIWESAGALKGGRKAFVSMRLPENIVIDAAGINDEIIPFVAVMNSHDGTTPVQAVVTPWRPVCGNTERFALRDAVTRWATRHTRNTKDRATEARRTMGMSLRYFERLAEDETALARNEMLLDEFRDLLGAIYPRGEEESKKAVTQRNARDDRIMEEWAVETARVGRTAYAAERAMTGYMDNAAPRRLLGSTMTAARATAVLEGADDELKSKVHKQLLLRVR